MNDCTEAQEAEQPGRKRLLAFALAALGPEIVRRGTLRAMLPAGETKRRGPEAIKRWHLGDRTGRGKNQTSVAFGHALQEFERNGWVERSPETVIVRDRRALLAFAHDAEQPVTPAALNVKAALTAARDDLRRARPTASPEDLQQRHDEIQALLYLLYAAGPASRAHALTAI